MNKIDASTNVHKNQFHNEKHNSISITLLENI